MSSIKSFRVWIRVTKSMVSKFNYNCLGFMMSSIPFKLKQWINLLKKIYLHIICIVYKHQLQWKYSVYASNEHATYIVINYRGMNVHISAFLVTCILLLIETCAASPNIHVHIVLNTQNSVYSCIIVTDPSVIK